MDAQATRQLFAEGDVCLPSVRQGEAFFSWCARFHRLNIGHDPRETSKALFGDTRAGLRHDIPYNMGVFEEVTGGLLGRAVDVLRERTVFGLHARFLPRCVEQEILSHLLVGENSKARGKLGLKHGGSSLVGQLKRCPECVAEQIELDGFGWWQIVHQLPTSLSCEVHGAWLEAVRVPQYRGVMRGYCLPSDGLEGAADRFDSMPLRAREQARKVGIWGHQIFRDVSLHLRDDALRWCYLLQAKVRGWIAFDGSVRLQALRAAFVAHYGTTLTEFGAEFLGDLNDANGGCLSYLFRQLPGRRHPVKHVLMLNFLFESFEEFRVAYQEVAACLESGHHAELEARLRSGQFELVRLMTEEGRSLNAAAAAVGVSATAASRLLDKLPRMPRERRPHIVGSEREEHLCRLLDKGISRKDMAAEVGVRLAFIKDYLSRRPEQRHRWEEANRKLLLTHHRKQLLTALEDHADLPIKAIRRLPGNGFQWLYNNDREWLLTILPALWKRSARLVSDNMLVE